MSSPEKMDLLQQLLGVLNPEWLVDEVIRPVQMAAESFPRTKTEPTGHHEFLALLGDFIRHLYWHAGGVPVRLSMQEAKAEAIHLLEEHYQGAIAPGCVGAVLDAIRPEGPGLEAVLTGLTDIVGRQDVLRLTTFTLVRLVNPADWEAKQSLV